MTVRDGQASDARPLPANWQRDVDAQVSAGERLLAWFRSDLDVRLHFGDGLVVLTSERLIARDTLVDERGDQARWQSWPLAQIAEIAAIEKSGYGGLQVRGQSNLMATWYYTSAQTIDVKRFIHDFNWQKSSVSAPVASLADSTNGQPKATIDQSAADEEVAAPAPPPVRSLWRLMRFARPWMGWILLGFVLTLASTAAGMIPPYLTIPLIKNVLEPFQRGEAVDPALLRMYLGGLFGAALLAWVLAWVKTYTLAWVSEWLSADIRVATYTHLQRMSLEFFGTKRTGDLISRVGSDTERINQFLSVNLADFGSDTVMIVMTAVVLWWLNPALAIVSLVPFPFIAWMIQRVRTRLRHGFARGSTAWAEMVNVLADTIPGIRVVKAFAQEQREIDRFQAKNQHVLDANNRVNTLWAVFTPTVTLLTDIGTLVIWGFGAWSVVHSGLELAVLVGFVQYISRLYIRLDSMSRMLAATQRAAAATNRVFEILDRKPSVAEPINPVHPGRLEGKIELRDVSFKYGDRQVLHNLNLSIAPGEMIGLVGPSGSGKSTVTNLICRFYDVTSGSILVDGIDIRSFPIEEYRHNIGIVLQEPFLFYGSIAENISYGRPDAPRGDIIAAARAARTHHFILKMPDAYDSLVGERGQGLSGGERQRVSIARALLTDPRILILDEATSSVDTETEREIQAALDNLVHGRTTIAIAHRISTLQKADRLVVLESGEITEVGKQADLAEGTGTYSRLHQAQIESVLGTQH